MHLNKPAVTKRCYCGLATPPAIPNPELRTGEGTEPQVRTADWKGFPERGIADWNANEVGSSMQREPSSELRSIYTQPLEMVGKAGNSKGSPGSKACVSLCPRSCPKFTLDPVTDTKSVKNQNSAECIERSNWLLSMMHELGSSPWSR